jgi:hypothetical protein
MWGTLNQLGIFSQVQRQKALEGADMLMQGRYTPAAAYKLSLLCAIIASL